MPACVTALPKERGSAATGQRPFGSPRDRPQSRLRRLEEDGTIASLTVGTWGKHLTEDDSFTEPACERYAELDGLGPGVGASRRTDE